MIKFKAELIPNRFNSFDIKLSTFVGQDAIHDSDVQPLMNFLKNEKIYLNDETYFKISSIKISDKDFIINRVGHYSNENKFIKWILIDDHLKNSFESLKVGISNI